MIDFSVLSQPQPQPKPPVASPYSHVLLITGSRTWSDEPRLRLALRTVWKEWALHGPITRPLLISGNAKHGADAMAERVWGSAGLEIQRFIPDWSLGKAAGLARNTLMVKTAAAMAAAGSTVHVVAFCMPCGRGGGCYGATKGINRVSGWPQHFSHGTMQCRSEAQLHNLHVSTIHATDRPVDDQ